MSPLRSLVYARPRVAQRRNRGRKAVYPRDGDDDDVDAEVRGVEEMEAPVSDEVSIDARRTAAV